MNTHKKNIILLIVIPCIFSLVFDCFYNMMTVGIPFPYPSFQSALKNFFYNLIPISLLLGINSVIVFKLPLHTRNLVLKIVADFILSGIVVILVNVLFMLVLNFLGILPRVNWAGTFFCNVIIMLGMESLYYYIRMLKQREEVQRMTLQYKYDVLKAQINPHFLFNSFNILYSLISLDTRENIKKYVLALSQMYRYIMMHQADESVLLRDEMDFLGFYVNVLKMRYDKSFDVEVQGESHIKNNKIIPYTMQLLVENVIKHNIISEVHPMKVTITIMKEGLTVHNPICTKKVNAPSQIGISYITELYALHDKKFHIHNDGINFTAFVPFLNYSPL